MLNDASRDLPRLDELGIAARAARDLETGMVVNLGYGIPVMVSAFVEVEREVMFHSENGILGFGPVVLGDPAGADATCINGAGQPVSRLPGISFMSHDTSFDLIRGGFVDIAFLGAIQVGANGDLANYHLPGRVVGSLGGAMDLAFCARRVVVLMTHQDRHERPKLVEHTWLPRTAPACVKRVITDVAVIDLEPDGAVLVECMPEWTLDDVQAITGVHLTASPDLHVMTL